MELSKAYALGRELMEQHGVDHLPLEWDRARTSYGRAWFYGSKAHGYTATKITLSSVLIPHISDAEVRETILHEIAHVHAGHAAGHNLLWQAAARKIGSTAQRCGGVTPEAVAASSKYKMLCEDGHAHGYRDRASKYFGLNAPAARPATCREHRSKVYLVENR